MIHKKMAYRNSSGKTLKYVFRGDGHEHDVLECVHHIHTQGLSPDPIKRGPNGQVEAVDTEPMEAEFDFLGSKNNRSENRFAHYVISLPEGEKLSHAQWKDVAKTYMKRMGYGLDTKWTAALHDEKSHQHIHIVACRVQNNPQGIEREAHRGKGNKPQAYPLVSDANDHARGMEVMRDLELKYSLSVTPSPDQTWGADLSRHEFKSTIRSYEKTGRERAPWKSRIILRLSKAVEQSKGESFTVFLKNCRAFGVDPFVQINEEGFPIGISYSMEGRSESGSRLKSSRLTFSALTGVKYDKESQNMKPTNKRNEGISYVQKRDIQGCIPTANTSRSDGGHGVDPRERKFPKRDQAEPPKLPVKNDSRVDMPAATPTKPISMSGRGGVEELLNLRNIYEDLDLHASQARKVARIQWGRGQGS